MNVLKFRQVHLVSVIACTFAISLFLMPNVISTHVLIGNSPMALKGWPFIYYIEEQVFGKMWDRTPVGVRTNVDWPSLALNAAVGIGISVLTLVASELIVRSRISSSAQDQPESSMCTIP